MVPYGSFHAFARSRYVEMLLKDVPIWHNLFAMFSTWTLLAGFLVLPGSFETLESLPINIFQDMVAAVKHLPL
jgi:hypothetical protein